MPEFKTKVAKYGGYGFTTGQMEGLDRLTDWYNDPKELIFVLSGRAGTGKTYMLKYFVDKIVNRPLCVSAPTHKAVRQIERSTGRKGKTLQSLHGLKPNQNLEDFDLNNIKFDALGNPTMNNYKIIIIDECSMVNNDLDKLNLKRAQDLRVKLLYVGDPMQLPPINKNDGGKTTISPTFLHKNKYELEEIIRQDRDNPLTKLLEILVYDIKTQGTSFLSYLKKNPVAINDLGEGYKVHTNRDTFITTALNSFKSDEFSKDPDHGRIAAWKNQTIMNYNIAIRNQLIPFFSGENAEQELIDKNDLLIGYKTITDEFNETVLINSEDYVILNVVPRMAQDGFKSYSVKVQPRHGGKAVDINIVDYRDKTFIVYHERLKTLYLSALYANRMERGAKWRKYFEYKDQHLSLITFPIKTGDQTKSYVSKDIDYAFALTVHKLQGSTIENTFVDLNDMLYYTSGAPVKNSHFAPNGIELRNKLIYTAISRTSKVANIYLNI